MINREEFLIGLKEQFESVDGDILDFDSKFKELQTWDSLTRYSIIAFIKDEFNTDISSEKLNSVETPEDLFKLLVL